MQYTHTAFIRISIVVFKKSFLVSINRDKTPTYFEDDPDKMIYILFDRMYGDDDILLFIRPNATELVYQAYFRKDEKPSIEDKQYIYSTEINVDKWTYEDGYKVKISADEFSTTGKIWIALRPLLGKTEIKRTSIRVEKTNLIFSL